MDLKLSIQNLKTPIHSCQKELAKKRLYFGIFITPFRSRILERTIWLNRFEIPLLHLARKKVILNSYGGDVAIPRLSRRKDLKYSLYDGYIDDPQYTVYDEKLIKKRC